MKCNYHLCLKYSSMKRSKRRRRKKMKYRIFNSEVVSVEDSLLTHIEINSEMSLRQPLQKRKGNKNLVKMDKTCVLQIIPVFLQGTHVYIFTVTALFRLCDFKFSRKARGKKVKFRGSILSVRRRSDARTTKTTKPDP